MNWLDLLDLFNWIDRATGLLAMLRYGRGRQIRIRHAKPDSSGRVTKTQTGNHYASILKRYKIPVYYRRATSQHLIFNVPAGQWQWAVDLLAIAGAQVEHKARPWAAGRKGTLPKPWESKTAVKR
jgi:hypothetical protein